MTNTLKPLVDAIEQGGAMRKIRIARIICLLSLFGLPGQARAAESAKNVSSVWPHEIPCRIHEGSNPDLFVMTLGPVKTSLAQGTFDPVADKVVLNDGTVISNYYRDVRGVKFYQPLDKSRFPLPPSGWCSWSCYYGHVNETEVKQNAAWMAANLKDYGAKYVQVDDGWQGGEGPRERNWSRFNQEHFPDGMAKLAAYIKSLGLEPGLWLVPQGQSDPNVVSNSPGVFLLKPDGSSASQTWAGQFLVDPSTPAGLDYLHSLSAQLAGWGFDYFKIDGQGRVEKEYAREQQFMRNPSGDSAILYRNTLNVIRDAIGPDRYLLGCWGVPLDGIGIMDGSRTGNDIVVGRDGFQAALRGTMQYYYLHNIAWYCDPDALPVRLPLTLGEARAWATLVGLSGQMLLASDRMMDLSADRVELLRHVFPATDIRPLDLFPSEREKRTWDLKIKDLGRQYDVVGVFNFGTEQSKQMLLKWKDLGLPEDQPVHVFDYWHQEYLGAWTKGSVVNVVPNSCRVLTLLPDDGRIQLISTSRHITQGWVDLVTLSHNSDGTIFTGTSKLIRNDPYELDFAFPRGTNFAISSVEGRVGWHKLPVEIFNHQGWAMVRITSPKTQSVKWSVQFAPADHYHFPAPTPSELKFDPVGLNGANLHWREQYELNAGYQVYLNGELLGYTPTADFPLRGLDPHAQYTVAVKTVESDGSESREAASLSFTLNSRLPAKMGR